MPVGEVLLPGAQDVPDPVQGVVPAAAVAGGVLLHPTPHIVDDLGGALDDVERVEHRAGVLELVIDPVLVPVERVQGGDLDPLAERLPAIRQPGLVRVAGPTGQQVEQPRPDDEFALGVRVQRQVHDSGQLLRAPTASLDRFGRHVVPVGSARGAVPASIIFDRLRTCTCCSSGVMSSPWARTIACSSSLSLA